MSLVLNFSPNREGAIRRLALARTACLSEDESRSRERTASSFREKSHLTAGSSMCLSGIEQTCASTRDFGRPVIGHRYASAIWTRKTRRPFTLYDVLNLKNIWSLPPNNHHAIARQEAQLPVSGITKTINRKKLMNKPTSLGRTATYKPHYEPN